MGGTCGTHGEEEVNAQGFGGEGLIKRALEHLGECGRIILKRTSKKWD
jgi:hypothetical protein